MVRCEPTSAGLCVRLVVPVLYRMFITISESGPTQADRNSHVRCFTVNEWFVTFLMELTLGLVQATYMSKVVYFFAALCSAFSGIGLLG